MTSMITEYVLSFLAILIILTVHEYSHGYVAYRLGDRTARNMGRLTLNPIKHIDPIGTLCMLFLGFGWAKPVPVSLRELKNPKRDFALIALAGPASNLILGFISGFIYLLFYAGIKNVSFENQFVLSLARNFLIFLSYFFTLNIGLAVFNLIPVPPLDGSRILGVIIPTKQYFGIMKHERKIYFVFIAWLFLGDYVKTAALSLPLIQSSAFLSRLVGIFSLSDIISSIIGAICNLIIRFWQIIPFLNF